MNIIPLLQSQVIRALLVALGGLIGLIVTKLGYTFDDKFYAQLTDAALLLLTSAATIWAGYARATKPTPPLTEGAAAKATEREAAEKQGGFARVGALSMAPLASVLVGCAALGLPVAKTFNERLASGYATVTAVREATSAWVDAKVRESQREADPAKRQAMLVAVRADAQNVQSQADEARRGLDIAAQLKGLDLKNADARLVSTLTILQALQQYLEEK